MMNKFWNIEGSLDNPNPLSSYLDPENTGITKLNGFNPYSNEKITRSQNYKLDEKPTESYFTSVPMLATNNTFGYTEFAEEFHSEDNIQLHGVFISSPAINNIQNMKINIRVYTGEKEPERIIHNQLYEYNYQYYSSQGFDYGLRDMNRSVENYIQFENPISLSGTFFISYSDINSIPNGFSVFNTEPRNLGSGIISTAWMKSSQGWVNSSENIENPINTSLLIAAYGIGDASVKKDTRVDETTVSVYYSGEVERVFIESNDDLLEWELYYVTGQKIHHERSDKSIHRASFSSSHLPKGIYIVKVLTSNGTVGRKKVLIH